MSKRFVTTTLLATLLGCLLYFTPSCGRSRVETQSPTTPASATGVVTTSDDTTPVAATPTGAPSAKIWEHGAVDVTGPWEGFVCYFWSGPHEQGKAHPDVPVSVPDGATVRFHFPNIKPTKPEHCKVQIDVATSCARSSIMPGMLAHDYKILRECENECVEAPTEETVCTECPTGDVRPEDCFRTCTKTIHYECKPAEVITFTEPCVCQTSCVEEGPYLGECGEWNECHEHPEEGCFQERECPRTWDCQDPDTVEQSQPCDCDCVPGEWETVETTEGATEWGECQRQQVTQSTVRPSGCLRLGLRTFYRKQFNGCEYRDITEIRDVREGCECPVLGACYYEIHGAPPEADEGRLCEAVGGDWDRWGPANKVQCRVPLPGILDHLFRLTPGQSHPDCLKYTGPR
jgi:hypothetical protein